MISGYLGILLNQTGRLDDGRRHTSLDMELDMAMPEMDARVIGEEAHGDEAVGGEDDCVAAEGAGMEGG